MSDKTDDWKHLTPIQLAYALLWRSCTTCAFSHRARNERMQALTLDERREAVKWVVETGGPMTTSELIAADMRSEIFPTRSYQPEAS